MDISEAIFTLTALSETNSTSKLIIFTFALPGYLMTVILNSVLVMIIILEKTLHQPMYIFLCNLCINGLYGASGFYPKFLSDLLEVSNLISFKICIIQNFIIFTYSLSEFTNLTVMAFDRYLAICRPLYYHSIMTTLTVWKFLAFIWMFPCCAALLMILMTLRFPVCKMEINKLFCDNWSLERIACSTDTAQFVLNGLFSCIFCVLLYFLFYSYAKIIIVCRQSNESRNKFKSTCLPHLIGLLNYAGCTVFDALYTRFGIIYVSQALQNYMSVTYLIFPPFVNPMIYGIILSPVRAKIIYIFQRLCCKVPNSVSY